MLKELVIGACSVCAVGGILTLTVLAVQSRAQKKRDLEQQRQMEAAPGATEAPSVQTDRCVSLSADFVYEWFREQTDVKAGFRGMLTMGDILEPEKSTEQKYLVQALLDEESEIIVSRVIRYELIEQGLEDLLKKGNGTVVITDLPSPHEREEE